MRGKLIGERAMASSAPPAKPATADRKDIMTYGPRHKATAQARRSDQSRGSSLTYR
jgi:hypothetical protein